jgi:hypothetical protein
VVDGTVADVADVSAVDNEDVEDEVSCRARMAACVDGAIKATKRRKP